MYVYARNIVRGAGPVFWPGERVEGFTQPLWVLLQALVQALGLAPARASVAIGVASFGAAVLASHWLWLRRPGRAGASALDLCSPAWLLAASPALAWHAVAGLGTLLLCALLALWMLAFLGEPRSGHSTTRQTLGAVSLGLAALLRPEALCFALPYAVHRWRRRSRSQALLALAPIAAWIVFRLAYYGRPLPNTYYVKKLPLADDLRYGLAYVSDVASNGFVPLALVVALGLALVPWSKVGALPSRIVLLGGSSLAWLGGVVLVGGDFLPLGRFLVPLAVPAAFLVCWLAARLDARLAALLVAGLACGELAVLSRERPRIELRQQVETERWIAIGRHLGSILAPEESIATSPVGAIAFESDRRVHDILGLTNDYTWRVAPDPNVTLKGHQRTDHGALLEQKPTLFVLGNGRHVTDADGRAELVLSAWEGPFLELAAFREQYRPCVLPIGGADPLVCYARQGFLLTSGGRWLR